MGGIKVKTWMWQKPVRAREIAKGYGCTDSFISRFIKGEKKSKELVKYFIGKGCPEEFFNNGKVVF